MIKIGKFPALIVATSMFVCSNMASADSSKKSTPNSNAKAAPVSTSNINPVKVNSNDSEDGYVAASSTHIDFSETAIDGKMKAPEGFLLQSRQSSSLSQMVKLRSNFRNEMNNSKSATKALVK